MQWPDAPCLLEGLSAADYHADRHGDVPTLSRSVAHTLITASPRHAAAEHPRLIGTAVKKQSDEMDLGTLVHALLLGGLEGIDVHDVPDWRGKRADLRDASRAAGQTPIKLGEFEKAVAAVEILKPEICRAVGEVIGEAPVWGDFGRELVALWEEPSFPEPLAPRKPATRCRARLDLYLPWAALIADVKVVTGGAYAKAGPFIRQLNSEEDSGAIQAASYCRGLEAVHTELAGRTTFAFLRVEPVPPYSVVPIVVTQGLRRLGEDRWNRATRLWASCLAASAWPGPGVAHAEVESWAWDREAERQAAEQINAEEERG